MNRSLRVVVAFMAILSSVAAAGQKPDESRLPDVRRWLADLADPDAAVRAAARIELMGIQREELEVLRTVVEQNRPLLPSQRHALRDIVMHVYLSGESYNMTPHGFLGVTMADPIDGAVIGSQEGVTIIGRIAGFCGYRMLQNGDVIVGVGERRLAGGHALRSEISNHAPGSTVMLQVRRGGRTISLAVTLDARPSELDPGVPVQNFISSRVNRADAYWQSTFAPLLEETVS